MNKTILSVAAAVLLAVTSGLASEKTGVGKNGVALASSPSFVTTKGEMVTMDNVVRAETAKYFAEETILTGPNKFRHERNSIDLKNQTIIRSNPDAFYSYAVYDASKGITVTVPPHEVYHSVQVFDENHVTLAVIYPGETASVKHDQLSYGDHVYLFMRTIPTALDEAGLKTLHEHQDAVVVKAGSDKPYVSEVKYDLDSFNKLRNDLIARTAKELIVYKGFIEDIKDIDAPHYQMANISGWGGLPASHAHYFIILPGDEGSKNGKPSSMTFSAPELQYDRNAFWSITIYDNDGWIALEPYKITSLNAKPNKDGTFTVNFNGPEGSINNVPVPKNWNGLFRCYLPISSENIIAFEKDVVKNSKPLSKTK